MSAAGPNEMLISLFMFFFSGMGLPVGVPPEQPDEVIARIAPEECLYYTAWSGMAEADPASANQTEQLLAEPEIAQLVKSLETQLDSVLQQAKNREQDPKAQLLMTEGPKLLKILMTHATAMFVADVVPNPQAPQIEAGLVVCVDEDADQVKAILAKVQQQLPAGAAESVELAGATFTRLQLGPKMPSVTWGIRGKYMVIGVGEGSVEGIFERAQSAPPAWLVDMHRELSVDRVSTMTYLNVSAAWEKIGPLAGPQVSRVVEALGLDDVKSVSAVTGLDGSGFLTRSLIAIDGPGEGLLQLANATPLDAEAVKPIPEDALVGLAFRLDVAQVLEVIKSIATKIEPRAADQMQEGIAEVERELGLSLQKDVLDNLGDGWTLSTASADGGLITGWVASVQVTNRETLDKTHQHLLNIARVEFGDRPRSPRIKQQEFNGQTIYYLVVPDDSFPLTPTWCLTGDRLVVAAFPQAIKSYLSRGDDYRSLADAPRVAQVLAADNGPIKFFYADTREIFRMLYPVAQVVMQMASHEAARQGIDIDPMMLPSARSIEKHLLPTVIGVRRTEAGIEIISHQSLPGGNVAATAPVLTALLLPAITSAQDAAKRMQSMNNMKQIALAMHNYHDTFRNFPAAYSEDEEKKPLLSWRVHILPFIEQQALYEQFHLDEPWDSEHNRPLADIMPQVYRAPGSKASPGKTNYLGVTGEQGVFVPPKKSGKWPQGSSMATITDGTSNTLMVVEANDREAVLWTKPGDFEPTGDQMIQRLIGLRKGGFLAGMTDGSVHFIAQSIDLDVLKALFTKNGGEVVRLP